MANDFVNTITTKDGTTYDIQDKRVDELETGTKLYKHKIRDGADGIESLYFVSTSAVPIVDVSKAFTISYNDNKIIGIICSNNRMGIVLTGDYDGLKNYGTLTLRLADGDSFQASIINDFVYTIEEL